MMKKSMIAAMLAVGGLYAFSAVAGDASPSTEIRQASPLKITLSVQKIVVNNDKEQGIDATDAEPGDVLEYRAEYKNVGKTVLRDALLTLPLPEHTRFVAGSARPAAMTVATRAQPGVFKAPAALSAAADASAHRYSALRWAVGKFAPGQTVTVGARVRVEPSAPATPSTPAADSRTEQ
jgi:uncharacterized repeat protein (TIGR01451 family)